MSARNKRFIARRSPVEGLSRRNLSFLPVFAQAVAAVAPAGAISVIPALVLGVSGTHLILVFALAMVVMLLVSLCLRPMARRMAAVSGLYSYTARGLGPRAAITAGWSAIFGYALIAMASLLAVGVYTVQLAASLGIQVRNPLVPTALVILGTAGVASLLMVRGIRISAGVTLLVECASIAILTILMVVYLIVRAPDADPGQVLTGNIGWDALPIGIVVAVSAFVGFESPSTLGGEARRPFVSVPRAMTWTPVVTGVFYLFAVTAQDIALRGAPTEVASSSTPLSDLFSQASPVFAGVLNLGIAASFFACTIASVNALARTLFCMGREGVAPRAVGRTHSVFRTPWIAIMAVIPVVAAVPIAVLASGIRPEQGLTSLFTLGAYGYLGSYILASASLPFFLHRIGENTLANWILAAFTSLIIGVILGYAAKVSVQAGNLVVFIYFGVVLASVVFAALAHHFAPRRLAGVGIYDETRDSDLYEPGGAS
ncbi:APC family permease (plasmid) [Arthrobacter sp. TES]|uniref:APC family permease n=1 Tax=Paenarthrobacter TaxID=1742992 RepID=UPI0003980607|nr:MULTISPECIES: APC family permease [Paenarthrobacter]ERI35632.1 transporter [Arthrobacter sp. AK-YN10]MCY0975685.1 APC family permease [Paenarthrobacter ureafaciens]QOI65879.1 APC family permease [Arthrobacter sp. TES]WOC63367.1 APC family permease [Paenarthrobacter sp. AT5]